MNRRVFVAEREGEVVGFITLAPVPVRKGWLTEQFPHTPGSPNGTVELMMDAVFRALAEDQCEYVTLGLSPLSRRAKIEPIDNPLWLRVLLAWMRKHGQRFYNFEGLDHFKSKLMPDYWSRSSPSRRRNNFRGARSTRSAARSLRIIRTVFSPAFEKSDRRGVSHFGRWLTK
jgi:lysylphosphatidylglycerol synthetase-like protein (DUF2156 family)